MTTSFLNNTARFAKEKLHLGCTLSLLLTLFLMPVLAQDQPKADDADAKANEARLRKARVQFLTDAAKQFEIRVGTESVESKLTAEPVLVYTNPVSGTKLGVLALFTRNGRPDVMAQFSFSAPTAVFNEFHNLCDESLTMKRGSRIMWSPQETSTKWKPLDVGEKPAGTPQLRLVQMRRIAENFSVADNFGWDKKELNQLRLLPAPIHRYGKPDAEVVDGAVFVYALATDPEAVLMLECVKDKSGLSWRYAFGPMSIYALTAELDGKIVWEIPERKIFGRPQSLQYVSPYQPAAGEKFPE
jgi:hypothetical protein